MTNAEVIKTIQNCKMTRDTRFELLIREECQGEIDTKQKEFEQAKTKFWELGKLYQELEQERDRLVISNSDKYGELLSIKQKVREFEISIDDLYHQVGKVTAWNVGSDIVCDLCEELVKEKFKELKELVK